MNLQRDLYFRCLIVLFPMFGLANAGTDQTSADPPGGYSAEFHKPDFNIVLARVLAGTRNEHTGIVVYELTVIGDMRSKLKPGAKLDVKGTDANTFSAILNIPRVPNDSVVAFPVMATAEPAKWDYHAMGTLPIGLDSTEAVPRENVIDALVALKELGAALDAPGGAGPSRERVNQLLHERNPYLWAFGAWRLSKDASLEDLEKLKALLVKPGTTPAQALWIDNLFDNMTGPAVAHEPTRDEQHNLLRRFLEGYVKESGQLAPTTRHE